MHAIIFLKQNLHNVNFFNNYYNYPNVIIIIIMNNGCKILLKQTDTLIFTIDILQSSNFWYLTIKKATQSKQRAEGRQPENKLCLVTWN